MDEVDDAIFNEYIEKKVSASKLEVETNNNAVEDLKRIQIKANKKLQSIVKYEFTYTMYDERLDKFIFNNLAYLNEKYCYDVQKHNYTNGLIVRKNLLKSGFVLVEDQQWKIYDE